jgi:hypothetical protein
MRRFIGPLVVLVSAAVASADGEKMPDYFPLKEGTKRHYRVNANGQPGQLTTHVVKIEKSDGQELARMETVAPGSAMLTEHLSSSPKGVFRHRSNGVEAAPPVCVLKYPVKKGESWETDYKAGSQTIKMTSRVTGEEEVEVPAGKYKAITVEAVADVAGMKTTTTYWFAADVGIVKQVASIGGFMVTLELEKFEPGK